MEFNGKKMTAFGMIEAEWSGEVNALAAQLQEHTDNTDNPHETTPKNIGAADYIVAYGTEESTDGYSGTWYWKKYASGEARCYGRFDFGSVACTKGWGNNGFHECEGMYKTFPAGLFADIPLHLGISLVTASGAAFITQDKGSEITAQKTGRFTLSRPTSMTITGVSLGFEVIGRWK